MKAPALLWTLAPGLAPHFLVGYTPSKRAQRQARASAEIFSIDTAVHGY